MLTREQLLFLFDRFSALTSRPDVKKRIADAVHDKQEAASVTTAIQEEIFQEIGIDPRYGILCLGKINTVYENDQDLMIRFYKFVAQEELACDEAELDPGEFSAKTTYQEKLQEQQLKMLTEMRRYPLDHQLAIFNELHQQLEKANFDGRASLLTSQQMQEIVQKHDVP
ncbi:hypothetical protein MLD38_013101 [Melastoma candidum]|uniref:Uncharacterized protein n=1 Tax=Melastoma candidum TaxID=119954 RepID=A0ACB9RBL8_9MYRT|nr:hypothetical protein MLD38_013101 [Melastoma candidum]